MSILRSTNCSKYTDRVSILVETHATVPGVPECSAKLPLTFSCQGDNLEAPDAATAAMLMEEAKNTLALKGCAVDGDLRMKYRINTVGASKVDFPAEELRTTGRTSNCSSVHDDVSHTVQATCYNMHPMTETATGKSVINTNMMFHASLATCDTSDAAMPQVYEDLKKVAMLNAADIGYESKHHDHFACKTLTLPVAL